MPVEIKELHLKFNIDNGSSAAAATGSTAKADAGNSSCSTDSTSNQRLVQTTTDEVLRIIEAKREER